MLRALGSRSGFAFLLIVLIFLGIFLRSSGQLGPVEDLTHSFLNPLQVFLIETVGSIGGLFGNFQDVRVLRAQVTELENQVNQLTVDAVRARELEIENAQLREQLGYRDANTDYDLAGSTILLRNPNLARITSQDPTALVNYVVIDQGHEEGVDVGMPVITPAGLVGRVSEVGTHWARVLLITDTSSSVNAVIQSSRATGVIQGQGSDMLLIKYLPQGEAVKENDIVLTSGIGGFFPKRLVIGQVVEVRRRDTDLFQEAVVRPSVDFNRLEFVLVMKEFIPSDITTEPTPTPTRTATPTRAPTATPTPAP